MVRKEGSEGSDGSHDKEVKEGSKQGREGVLVRKVQVPVPFVGIAMCKEIERWV